MCIRDSYNTAPDTPETSDSLYYIDTAQDLLNELQTRIEQEGKFLLHPSLVNDGEGRLKGNN